MNLLTLLNFAIFTIAAAIFVPPISSAKQRITYPYSVKSFSHTSYDYLADFTELANQLTICSRRVKAEPTVTQSAPISIATFANSGVL